MAPRGEKLGPQRRCSVDLEGVLLGNSNKLKSEFFTLTKKDPIAHIVQGSRTIYIYT